MELLHWIKAENHPNFWTEIMYSNWLKTFQNHLWYNYWCKEAPKKAFWFQFLPKSSIIKVSFLQWPKIWMKLMTSQFNWVSDNHYNMDQAKCTPNFYYMQSNVYKWASVHFTKKMEWTAVHSKILTFLEWNVVNSNFFGVEFECTPILFGVGFKCTPNILECTWGAL